MRAAEHLSRQFFYEEHTRRRLWHTPPRCDPRYDSFIDHIVLDKGAGAAMAAFAESHYATGAKHYSDHCPVAVTLSR